jgi:hypothetical protein
MIRSDHDLISLLEHDLFGKPVPAFRHQALAARSRKFNLVSILSALSTRRRRFRKGPEGVDAAEPALYKTPIGGGRNPAAAVL